VIKIELEKVNIPTVRSEKNKIKIETEKVNIPTVRNERRKIKIETEKVNIPKATSTERRKIKIEADKPEQPVLKSNERRKIKIEVEKVNIPTVRNERRRIKIEGEKEDQPEGNLRDRVTKETTKETTTTVVDKRTIKEQLIPIWLKECKVKDAGSFALINTNNEKLNKVTEEYNYKITELETTIREKDEELNKMVSQLKEIDDRKNYYDTDSYQLRILTDKQSWNETVQHCPINNLYVQADKKDWNEINEISQLDLSIISLGKNWDDIVQEEGRDALFVSGYEKDPLAKQNINLLQINGQPLFEKWLDQIQPNEIEHLDIVTKEKEYDHVVEEGTTFEVQGMEKDTNSIQRINYIFVQGEKRPWENLEEVRERIQLEKTERPDNDIEQRDSIEIVSLEKDPLVRQLIDALYVSGISKPENDVQRTGEMVIEKTPKPDNVLEQRDSVEIVGAEKDALQLQPINQLFIAGVTKPENYVQRTGEMEIEKTPKPENVLEQRDSVEIIGAEKDSLQLQSTSQLTRSSDNSKPPKNLNSNVNAMHSQVPDSLGKLSQHEMRLKSTVIEFSRRKMSLKISDKTTGRIYYEEIWQEA